MSDEESHLIGYWNMDKTNPKVVFSQTEKEDGMEMFIITFKPVPMTSVKNFKEDRLDRAVRDLKDLAKISRRLLK